MCKNNSIILEWDYFYWLIRLKKNIKIQLYKKKKKKGEPLKGYIWLKKIKVKHKLMVQISLDFKLKRILLSLNLI